MKRSPLFALALFLPLSYPARAADERTFAIIETNSGKVYANCSVYKTQPDGVIIAFKDGGAKLLYSDLAPELRAALGYDPEKEAAYKKELAEQVRKDQEEREELAKQRSEMTRLQTASLEAEAARYQFMSMQAGYAGYGGGGGYPYAMGYPYASSFGWSYPYASSYGWGYPYAASYTTGYPYASSYGWGDPYAASYCGPGYTSGHTGYFPGYGYRSGSAAGFYGYGGAPNSPYACNYGYNVGRAGDPYSYGAGTYHGGRGAAYQAPYGTNWNVGYGWNGNAGWRGNTSHGHHAGARGFYGAPQLHAVGRPHYNIPAPCGIPAAPRAICPTPTMGGRGARR